MRLLGFEFNFHKAPRIPVSRNDIKTKVGDYFEFYGNLVRVTWIDHAYVTIKFIRSAGDIRIAIHVTQKEFFSQCNKWTDELECLKPAPAYYKEDILKDQAELAEKKLEKHNEGR